MGTGVIKSIWLLSLAGLPLATKAQKPNIVLFLADDVSWNDFGCYGNKDVKTPNIDRLAGKGIRFTNFFLTASSCSPSRNSIITGRYPHNTGAAELHTEPPVDMISFPEILKKHGHYTAQAGKFHMGEYARRGFDLICENEKLNGDGGEDQWIQIIQNRPKNQPFMFWFASYDAHRTWGPNEFSGIHPAGDLTPPFYLVNAPGTKDDLAKYYDEIARLDHYIGLVVDELRKQNVLENTVILVMADNGRPFPHSKTRVNDRGMKTPFVISWPKGIGSPNEICTSLVSSIDIAPTLLELAEADVPGSFQGRSFKKLLSHPGQSFRNYVFAEHNWHDYEAHERMVRTKDYLYILNSRPQFPNFGPLDAVGSPSFKELSDLKNSGKLTAAQAEIFIAPRPAEEFYNNNEDPDQLTNLADIPEYQQRLTDIRQVLNVWMNDTGDNIPENLTKDWYLKERETVKTSQFGIRQEMPGEKRNATKNNSKGPF